MSSLCGSGGFRITAESEGSIKWGRQGEGKGAGWGWGGNVGVHVAKLTAGGGDCSPGRYCGFNWLQSHPFCPRCPPPLPQPGFSFLVPAAAIAGYNEKGRGEMTGKQNPKVTHRSTLHSCAGSSTSVGSPRPRATPTPTHTPRVPHSHQSVHRLESAYFHTRWHKCHPPLRW